MPEISVSDSLYRQLEDASEERETEEVMWQMLHLFQRGNRPAE